MGAVVLSVEGHPVFTQQTLHQGDRLFEAGEPFLLFGPFDADGGHFVHRLARADTEKDAARVETTQSAHRLRHDTRVVAEGRGDDAGPQADRARALAQRRQPGKGIGRVPACMPPGLEVVAHDDGVESHLFGEDGKLQEFARAELFGRSFVTEREQGNPPRDHACCARFTGRIC